MKGVIFTEFVRLVESAFGEDMMDSLIDSCDLPSGGAYTAVSTYHHSEIVQLVVALSEKSETPVPDLLKTYGNYLFGRFVDLYPGFFEGRNDAFSFLESIEGTIHVEVKKLYPDAELPSFDTSRPSENQLEMVYESSRHLEDVAHGLMQGYIDHFGDPCTIDRNDDNPDSIRFLLSKVG